MLRLIRTLAVAGVMATAIMCLAIARAAGTVDGTVFADHDANGLFDPGDEPLTCDLAALSPPRYRERSPEHVPPRGGVERQSAQDR